MIQRQLKIFLIVGVLTVAIDFVIYRSLSFGGLVGQDSAKAIGFISGSLFAYFANKVWTFNSQQPVHSSIFLFAVLYAFTLGANVWVNHLLVINLAPFSFLIETSFLVATMISATLNFMGMKFIIFRNVEVVK